MIVQTMLLSKAPAGGRGIALHQDTHYLPNDPNTLMACWVALTDTDGDNGGLCVVPGSHLTGLRQAQRSKNEQEQVSWETEITTYATVMAASINRRCTRLRFLTLTCTVTIRLTVLRGTGVLFDGRHDDPRDRSPTNPRSLGGIAFAVHYVREGTWLLPLQRPGMDCSRRCDVPAAIQCPAEAARQRLPG